MLVFNKSKIFIAFFYPVIGWANGTLIPTMAMSSHVVSTALFDFSYTHAHLLCFLTLTRVNRTSLLNHPHQTQISQLQI